MFENVFVNVQLYNVQNVNWMILRPGWLGLRPVWLGLRPGWLDRWTNGKSPFYRTLSPIGVAAQKVAKLGCFT